MTESASSTSGQEFDVFSVMDWKDGVGTLPGSDLKFRVNEFGALEVITDESEMENVKKATATTTWMVPTAQEVFSEKTGMPFRLKDPVKVEGLQFCENCCHYGNVDECLSGGSYCSQNCARHIKDKDQKEERDIGEDNEEEDPKCSRKKKPKLSLKADSKEDGEERDDEMENKQDGRILRGSQRARRKRRGDSAVLKQGKKAWCWASYLEEEKAVAVPAKLFKEYQSFPYNKNGFKVGMKLEGVDPEHQSVYCVLTVAEVCGYRIKLHFDGYSDCYDFWVNADALDIHPVGWCEKTGHKLHPPKGYKEEEFNWQTYLKTCKAQAAPKSLFENQNITVIPSGFRVGMKLEAVDKKNPAFICVATVTDMVDNRFLVHFDNWDESYDYWLSKCETFFLGQILRRNQFFTCSCKSFQSGPLELMEASEHGGCSTPGCKGIGHFKRVRHLGPHSAANCPYSEINLNKDRIFPDRLSGEMPPASPSFPRNKRADTNEISSSPEIRDQHADDVKEDFEERTESEMRTSHEARECDFPFVSIKQVPGKNRAYSRHSVDRLSFCPLSPRFHVCPYAGSSRANFFPP
ncbi:hypothetical protein GH733_000730 [Mirounga leonina]|nr:hypothetical protein GH733_000730 [Mirounga leonina]